MTTTGELQASLPVAPISAYEPADWRDVPKGFYAVPVWDWAKFSDECGQTGDPSPVAELIGYALFTRKVPTGKRGRDQFTVGRPMVAEGTGDYVWHWQETTDSPREEVRRTPWERLCKEIATDKFVVEHEHRGEGSTEPRCRCSQCAREALAFRDSGWAAVPNQREAYANAAAGAILEGIKNYGDAPRKLYGQLTGRCGCCGRVLTDPASKLLGIGPDCLKAFRDYMAAQIAPVPA